MFHSFIKEIYEGKAKPSFLNSLIEGQKTWPLETYLRTADAMLWAALLLLLLGFFVWRLKKTESRLSEFQKWTAAGFIAFFLAAAGNFRPELLENELFFLINPRRLVTPGYLAADWMWQAGNHGHFIFDFAVSPFARFLDNLTLALAGRALVWTFLIFSLVRLARTLELKWWEFLAAFTFWFYANQSLAAGEWIFGGFEAKCLAYAFLFLALNAALKLNWPGAGLFAGLAVSFHILVGGWGALALFLILLPNLKVLKRYLVPLVIFGLPGLIASLFGLFRGGGMTGSAYRIVALFHAPHHMDPRTFLSPWGISRLLIYTLFTFILLGKAFKGEFARPLSIFLGFLTGIFLLGILAREAGMIPFLFFYPFRLGPLFLLLFFSLAAFHFRGRGRSFTFGLIFFLLFETVYFQMPVLLFKQTRGLIYDWMSYFSKKEEEDDFSKLAEWIKAGTPKESIFIAPPWEYRFWILTERAQIAAWKGIPADHRSGEWLGRLESLNGGKPFQSRGAGALTELKQSYPRLSAEELQMIKEKYGAQYYLVTRERPDLPFPLLYSNGTYYLYGL